MPTENFSERREKRRKIKDLETYRNRRWREIKGKYDAELHEEYYSEFHTSKVRHVRARTSRKFRKSLMWPEDGQRMERTVMSVNTTLEGLKLILDVLDKYGQEIAYQLESGGHEGEGKESWEGDAEEQLLAVEYVADMIDQLKDINPED